MTFTDGIHLTADSLDELHEFASKIGLKRSWFQNHLHPHYYNLPGSKLNDAIIAGAQMIPTRLMVLLSLTNASRKKHQRKHEFFVMDGLVYFKCNVLLPKHFFGEDVLLPKHFFGEDESEMKRQYLRGFF